MKLNDLLVKIENINADKSKSMSEISILERELDEINAKAESAAAAGNEDEYIRLTDDASRLTRRIYVKKKTADKTIQDEIPEHEVAAAWKQYATEYGKGFNAKYQKFEKVRKQLCDAYKELLDEQQMALATRKRIEQIFPAPGHVVTTSDDRFPFTHIPVPQKRGVNGVQHMEPKIYCYGIQFTNFLTPLFYEAGDIDRETAEQWEAILNGSTDALPERTYRPKVDRHIDPLGLFINQV